VAREITERRREGRNCYGGIQGKAGIFCLSVDIRQDSPPVAMEGWQRIEEKVLEDVADVRVCGNFVSIFFVFWFFWKKVMLKVLAI
jgi:hypothetical protein